MTRRAEYSIPPELRALEQQAETARELAAKLRSKGLDDSAAQALQRTYTQRAEALRFALGKGALQ